MQLPRILGQCLVGFDWSEHQIEPNPNNNYEDGLSLGSN
jgi:hypothetical protein